MKIVFAAFLVGCALAQDEMNPGSWGYGPDNRAWNYDGAHDENDPAVKDKIYMKTTGTK